ncbi:MAG: indolepyruvate ferredoxin oxidoreductase subunit alpha [candidate division KSB1 bacterium]|nr:indolepyruvate ferredoxin oxidoreductase subunit alpha [candidate division KSB1 bacterium]MDZ7303529.1 indolepyruvate ferredoxin oxidoreductase subunit alpha [candidate division KSB1 bacterium]MDZ7312669.1 indolepyruvate ferredoxin oxidoreductase subunit alpha [candidate division KSB1 bacterium]
MNKEQKVLLSGNEAIARGAFEAGAVFASAYPGTPSTEILEAIAKIPAIKAQWAPNEKVALETAAGAALAGGRALVAMKHVGLNVAADPFFSLSYMGVNAGLVIVSADDPGMHSSQNEQDNRWYARAAKIPMLEPADSQEAKDFTRLAFFLSEKYDTPVLLRITTRIAHSMSPVVLGQPEVPTPRPYQKDFRHRVLLPSNARARHAIVEKKLREIEDDSTVAALNQLNCQNEQLGIITAGVAYQYAREVFPEASFLKLGLTFPLPQKLIEQFALQVDKVYVIEELDPFLEEQLRALGIDVWGKEFVPQIGELDPGVLRRVFQCDQNDNRTATPPTSREAAAEVEVPPRPPLLCPGCPHTGMFYAFKKLRLTVMGDIGCYTLGALPPLSAMDTCLNMGASIGLSAGMRAVLGEKGRKVVAVIGDSTFIHSGITGLIDVVYNDGADLIVILDNETTAMTGRQEHPGTGITLQGKKTHRLDLVALCHAIGIKRVVEVNPYDLDTVLHVLKTELSQNEPAVVISKAPCILKTRQMLGPLFMIDMEKCRVCNLCLKLGCPAIEREGDLFRIDPAFCVGCGLCARVCHLQAIVPAAASAG